MKKKEIPTYELEQERDKLANEQFIKLAQSSRHEDREKAADVANDIIKERIRE